jgi:hypothetical protein
MQELESHEPNEFYENSTNAKQQFIQEVATLSVKGANKHHKNSHEKLDAHTKALS